MRPRSFFLELLLGNLLLVAAVIVLMACCAGLSLTGATGWGLGVVAVAGAGLSLLISYLAYRPVRQITSTARRIASGNLSILASPFDTAELSQLSAALNEMRESLAGQIDLIGGQRESLQAVISNLREGILATDAAGNIRLANQAARQLLFPRCDDPIGKHIHSVVSVLGVIDAFHQAQQSAGAVARQVEVADDSGLRQLDVHASAVAPGRGGIACLLVVHDVTDITRMAAMKAEFVANASHELRTPLATIRAAVDSLVAEAPANESLRRMVEILDRQVSRLENLTRDLLDLNLVESGRSGSLPQQVSLEALAQWAGASFQLPARNKGVALEIVAGHDASFASDRMLLELILQNLLENGIKFTPAGGRVRCEMEATAAAVLLRVIDTGCGIAQEARSRVFERFFQVDPARSGGPKTRGSGLGLSIVKHAAERLGARVDLQSQLGQGTTVTVTIPRG